MTWCKDIARDAAVRAAEDNRTRPLPTLGEAIAVFSPSEEGLRTERVTLEIVRGDGLHVRQWPWRDILMAWGLGEEDEAESVRVVSDEPSSDADAEVLRRAFVASEIKRLKAGAEVRRLQTELEAASGGGEGEPVAYLLDGPFEKRAFRTRDELYAYRRYLPEIEKQSMQLVPLYRQPPQPRGWLSEEERRVLSEAADVLDDRRASAYGRFVRVLIARSSPPEVVLPLADLGDRLLRDGVIDALAAAGVAVKEVGSE